MLLDRNRDLKLVDFGLSTKYPDDNLLDQPCGTVVYAAPEVLQGKEYHGMLADVWSSGIVLYGMLSGYLPFGEQDDDINRINIISGKISYPNYFSDCVKDLLMHMLDLDPMTRYTLQEVRSHPWFNLIDYRLIPGIIIGYNVIPVDEKILDLCVTYNCDREKVRESVINNKYNSDSALYYLLIKKLQKKGFHSVSDFCSHEFISFVLDDNNLIDEKNITERNKNKVPESEIKYNVNINANNNCSAPPDGKLKNKEKNEKKNLETPLKNGDLDFELINKKINFEEEESKGALSYIINSPSFEDTNKEIFNQKSSYSIGNKNMKKLEDFIDIENKKTNKNTSSESKKKIVLQPVNVNDFQIIDNIQNKKEEKNIIINNNGNNNNKINNDFMKINDEEKNENDYKILNVFYHNTDSDIDDINGKNDFKEKNLSINNNQNIFINSNKKENIQDSKFVNISNNSISNNSIEIITNIKNGNKNKNNDDILQTPVISPIQQGNNNGQIKEILIYFDKRREKKEESKVETPKNNKLLTNKKEKTSNKNTLSKQKVYIDKTKTYSNKKRHQNNNNNELNLNRIKDIRKINLFQDEIKEEEKNEQKNMDIIQENENILKNDNSPKIAKNVNMLDDISLVNDSNDLIDKNNIIEKVINIKPNPNSNKEENNLEKKEQEIKVKTNEVIKIPQNKNMSSIDKNKKKQTKNNNSNNKKVVKKKDNNGKNSKIKIDTNKSIEFTKNKNASSSRDKNSYSAKHKLKKMKEKEIVSIKVIINKDLKSKEKNIYRNNLLKNKTEQQNRKIKSIYNMGIKPTNLSKNKYSIIKKKQNNSKQKPSSSNIKNKLMKSVFTTNRKQSIFNNTNNKTHIKSSSIQLFNTVVKSNKYVSKYIKTCNNSKSHIFKMNNLIKSKKKTSNTKYSNNKSIAKNNVLMKSYNNKYMKLFRSTQYKNNHLLFTNKIDKTNLNKKFNEIAHKINKNNKINLNNNNAQNKNNKINENKKIPLWKYIQSDFNKNSNTSSSSVITNKKKKGVLKIPVVSKIIKEIKPKGIINKSINSIVKNNFVKNHKNQKPNQFINSKIINVNKNKSSSNEKEKNINLIFINIKNYINDKNVKRPNRYLESSASNQKYKSTYNYRELSESMKNKCLNKKSRAMRIPWKIIKKSIDEKLKLDELYKAYLLKSKNPFNNNDNKKIKVHNIKPIQDIQKKIMI